MIRALYPAPPICTDPSLGTLATQALGRRPAAPVVAHLASCLPCRLQRATFERLDDDAVPPSPALHARLRKRALFFAGKS